MPSVRCGLPRRINGACEELFHSISCILEEYSQRHYEVFFIDGPLKAGLIVELDRGVTTGPQSVVGIPKRHSRLIRVPRIALGTLLSFCQDTRVLQEFVPKGCIAIIILGPTEKTVATQTFSKLISGKSSRKLCG